MVLPSVKQRDVPNASGRLTSFRVKGRGRRVVPRSSCVSIVGVPMRAVHFRSRHFNGRQSSGLNKLNYNTFDCWTTLLLGGGWGVCLCA